MEPHQWVALVSYRYFHSFRDFKGDEEVHIPVAENDTYLDAFDVSATYAITKRLSLTLEIPFQYGSRTNKFEHDGVHVHTMRAAGMGDLRLSANFLLLNPDKHPNQNISLELGVKAPTGDDAHQIIHSALLDLCCDRLILRFNQEMEVGAFFCQAMLLQRSLRILMPTLAAFI